MVCGLWFVHKAAYAFSSSEQVNVIIHLIHHVDDFNFTVSIGVVEYDGHPDYQRFLDVGDAALYQAKNSGRNLVHVASSPE